MSQNWRQSLTWVLRVNIIFLVIDIVLLPILAVFYSIDVLTAIRNGYLTTMLFIESGVIFLAGGAIAMSGSIFFSKIKEHFFHSEERWSAEKQKKNEQKANLYILAGAFMFLESLVLALTIF